MQQIMVEAKKWRKGRLIDCGGHHNPAKKMGNKKDNKSTPSTEEKSASTDAAKPGNSKKNNNESSGEFLALVDKILAVLWQLGVFVGFLFVCQKAYNIRLFAVEEYGAVIHEFDPYFNFRSAEYLVEHGWFKFINW